MPGVYSQGDSRPGRKHSGYSRFARRRDAQILKAQSRLRLGPQKVISISTNENTPEWRWFQSMGSNTRATRSRASRDALRQFLVDRDQSTIIEGLMRQLKARNLEIECRDLEIRELRHSLGLHFENPDPKCEVCE